MRRALVRALLVGYACISLATVAATPPPASAGGDRVSPELTDDKARSQWQLDINTVEQDVTDMKQKVFHAKATLQLLREVLISSPLSESRVLLTHENRLGRAYTLESARYFVDGRNVYAAMDPSGLARTMTVLDRPMAPGPHNVQVNLTLRGRNVTIFRYLQTYSFRVQSSHSFTVDEGEVATVQAIIDDSGVFKASFVDRPTIEFRMGAGAPARN